MAVDPECIAGLPLDQKLDQVFEVLVSINAGGQGDTFDPHSPGPIGDVTPSTGAFTTLSTNGDLTVNGQALINSSIRVADGNVIYWSSGDLYLTKDAANTLALRNGVNPQALRVYSTYTDASNYARMTMWWSGTEFQVSTESAGTGGTPQLFMRSKGILYLSAGDNNAQWQFSTAGHFLAQTDNTYDIGASGANRPRAIYVAADITAGGNVTVGSFLLISGRGFLMGGDTSGVLRLSNASLDGFNRLQFGGTTASFPALKRNGTELQVRLADDSNFAKLVMGAATMNGTVLVNSGDFRVADMPTSDPGVAGQFWNDSGTVKISG